MTKSPFLGNACLNGGRIVVIDGRTGDISGIFRRWGDSRGVQICAENAHRMEETMKTSIKIITGAVLIGILAAAGMRLMKKDPPIEAAPLPNVSVESPKRGDITLESGLIGTIQPSDMIHVTPKVAGEIAETYVKAGEEVVQGQSLCRIDNAKQIDSARIQMNSAAVALQNAQATLNRMQVLFAAGDISAQAFEQTQTQVQAAKLQYDGARLAYNTQVEYSTVTAPISGRLESVSMDYHSMVSQSSVLCVITGEGVQKVSFSVPERIRQNLTIGDYIRLEKQGTEYQAAITDLASMVSAQTGLFEVEGMVENGEALSAGSTVKIYVVSDHVEGAVTVPVDAVYYEGGDAYLYTAEDGSEGSVVHKVPVETGLFDDERIEILSGIGMGEQVITTWSSELYEGSLVNIVSRDGKAEAKSQAAEPESQAAEPEEDSAENDSQ